MFSNQSEARDYMIRVQRVIFLEEYSKLWREGNKPKETSSKWTDKKMEQWLFTEYGIMPKSKAKKVTQVETEEVTTEEAAPVDLEEEEVIMPPPTLKEFLEYSSSPAYAGGNHHVRKPRAARFRKLSEIPHKEIRLDSGDTVAYCVLDGVAWFRVKNLYKPMLTSQSAFSHTSHRAEGNIRRTFLGLSINLDGLLQVCEGNISLDRKDVRLRLHHELKTKLLAEE